MVVDCGGGTVDLTTRELLDDDKLSEITERTGDYCGSCYVDQEYIKQEMRDKLVEAEWIIEIKFDDVKKMFDHVIERILKLIKGQLEQSEKECSVMLLVGGFS